MIRTHFDSTFHSSFGYAVIAVGGHDKLLVINPVVVATLPVWAQEAISNQMLALADDLPPGDMAKIIDLVQVRAVRDRDTAHDCPASTPAMHFTHP